MVTRAYYPDAEASDAVISRAYAVRQAAGLLTGHAAGEQDDELTPAARLLDDMRTVFATAEVAKLSTERVLELLGELRPAVYGGWSPEALAAALRPDGVSPGQVWTGEGNPQGVPARGRPWTHWSGARSPSERLGDS